MHNMSSPQKVAKFLEDSGLSKKELANMIDVSYSYAYNLSNDQFPFTTKRDTLEKLAVVMGIEPSEFSEYKVISYEPSNSTKAILLDMKKETNLSNLEILQSLPYELRSRVVDVLRGVESIPPDINFVETIVKTIKKNPIKNDYKNLLEASLKDSFNRSNTELNNRNLAMIEIMVDKYIESRCY